VNPERLSRDAVRLIDRMEREQVKRIKALLASVYQDARDRLSLLDLSDDSIARAVREVQIRRVLEGSTAARQLLTLGRSGPLADAMRSDIQRAYEIGLRTAGEAIQDATPAVAGAVGAAAAFGTRIDLELLAAMTESTLTTLQRVGERGLERLLDTLVRVAVRGAGPRAGAREVRDAIGVTRSEAERITRTVLMRSNNEARRRGFENAGIEFVRFDATNDTRTCPYCAARHGMVYELKNSPGLPLHPNCRCVLLPFQRDASPADRADAYYEETRRDLRERDTIESRPVGGSRSSPPSGSQANTVSTATAAAPFERADGIEPPEPVYAPGRGWL